MKLSTLVKDEVHHHLVACLQVQESAFHKLQYGWVIGLRAAVVISSERFWVSKDVVNDVIIQLAIMRDYNQPRARKLNILHAGMYLLQNVMRIGFVLDFEPYNPTYSQGSLHN